MKRDCEKRRQEMTNRIENLRQEVKAETQRGLEAVGDECRKRHEEITVEMERRAEEKAKELGNRIEKHEGEMEEQFRIMKEEISKTNKEVTQVKGGNGAKKRESWGAIARDAKGRRTGDGRTK